MGSELVGETQITKNAASHCLRAAAAPGDRSESVHQPCKLFILPPGSCGSQRKHCRAERQVLSPAQVGGQKNRVEKKGLILFTLWLLH